MEITAVSKRARRRIGVGEHFGSGSDFSDLATRPLSGTETLELMLCEESRETEAVSKCPMR